MNDFAQKPAPTPSTGTPLVKRGLADMLKGGVIMDVVTPEQARIAEDAGAVAVMALERVPAIILFFIGMKYRKKLDAFRRQIGRASCRERV